MNAVEFLASQPYYRRYWLAMLISNLGNWMQGTSQGWLVLQLSNSAEALGMVVALQFLPSLLFSLPAGVLADSLPRRQIVQTSQSLMMLLAVLMAMLVWSGQIAYWHLLVSAFVQGTLMAVDLPARQALVVELVSKEHYPQAMPLNSFAFNLSRLAGPALAGLCISTVGLVWAYWINALSFVPFIWCLYSLPSTTAGAQTSPPPESNLLSSLMGGLHYLRSSPAVSQLLLMLGWVGTFGVNFQTLIPAYSHKVLGLEAKGYGLLMSALGIGALLGSSWQIFFVQGRENNLSRRSGRIFKAVAGLTLLHLLMTLPLPVWAIGLLWIGCGFSMATVMINTNTSVQTLIPDELRGRLMALYSMVLLGATPLGAWLTGWLFDHLGGRPTAGILGLLTGLSLVWVLGRALLKRQELGLGLLGKDS